MKLNRVVIASVVVMLALVSSAFAISAAIADYYFNESTSISKTWSSSVPKAEWALATDYMNRSIKRMPIAAKYHYEAGRLLRLCATYWVDCGRPKARVHEEAFESYLAATRLRRGYGDAQIDKTLTERDLGFDAEIYGSSMVSALHFAPFDPGVSIKAAEVMLTRWDELEPGGFADSNQLHAWISGSARSNLRDSALSLHSRFAPNIESPEYFHALAEFIIGETVDYQLAEIVLKHWHQWPRERRSQLLMSLSDLISNPRYTGRLVRMAREENKVALLCAISAPDGPLARICQDKRLVR